MSVDEAVLWERLAKSRRAPLEPDWLGEVYSPSLSVDLRRALCEKLGMLFYSTHRTKLENVLPSEKDEKLERELAAELGAR